MKITLPKFPVEGGCVCGAVRYRLSASPMAVYACHCKDCQRSTGTPFQIGVLTRRDSFTLLSGETRVYQHKADSGRVIPQHSCAICNTRMWNEPPLTPELIILRAGTLDDMTWAQPTAHIWTRSQVSWVDTRDTFSCEAGLVNREPLYAAWAAATSDATP